MKAKKLTITVGKYAHCLWDSECGNFIKEDPDRFVLLEGKKQESGTLYFCERYLEAVLTKAYHKAPALYSDEAGGFVVASKKRFR